MHRFGQQVRRDLLRPLSLDHAHGTTGTEAEPQHLQALRRRLEDLDSNTIREMVETQGADAVLRYLGTTLDELQRLERDDPPGFEKCRDAQLWDERGLAKAKDSIRALARPADGAADGEAAATAGAGGKGVDGQGNHG